jgi:hypothetical protein
VLCLMKDQVQSKYSLSGYDFLNISYLLSLLDAIFAYCSFWGITFIENILFFSYRSSFIFSQYCLGYLTVSSHECSSLCVNEYPFFFHYVIKQFRAHAYKWCDLCGRFWLAGSEGCNLFQWRTNRITQNTLLIWDANSRLFLSHYFFCDWLSWKWCHTFPALDVCMRISSGRI